MFKTNLKVQCNANEKTAILNQNYKIDINKVIYDYDMHVMLKKDYRYIFKLKLEILTKHQHLH